MSAAPHAPGAQAARTGLPVVHTAPAALVASLGAALATAPLDLLAVRAQLGAASPAAARAPLPSLWTGVGFSVARIPLFALVRAASLQAAASAAAPSGAALAALAMASHAAAAAVTHPLDTLKTARMAQAPRGPLWAGLPVALGMACVGEAAAALCYRLTRPPSASSPPPASSPIPFLPHAAATSLWSAAAAVCAVTLATHPLDTLKRRLQIGAALRPALQHSLYAGLPLALTRGLAFAAIQLSLYEPLLHFTASWLRVKAGPA